jgi:hypothetical protein
LLPKRVLFKRNAFTASNWVLWLCAGQ